VEHLGADAIEHREVDARPSSVGSMCTRNGRLPKGVSTGCTIASTAAEASASGGTISAKVFCLGSPKPA